MHVPKVPMGSLQQDGIASQVVRWIAVMETFVCDIYDNLV